MQAIVTGGAGFIGSHIVDKLIERNENVLVIDNLRTGSMVNLHHHIGKRNFHFINCDLTDYQSILDYFKNCNIVFHCAANPEVRIGAQNTEIDFQNNIIATRNVLEACIRANTKSKFIFTSTSAVYGDATQMPTSENYGPLLPISLYAASKFACEGLISGYCNMFNLQGYILRLANIIGPRSSHGIIYDFLNKLMVDSTKLEILGDGKQSKSYLYISDCIEAIFRLADNPADDLVSIYNIGSMDRINVISIAKIIMSVMGLTNNVEISFSDKELNGRGWKGDVRQMLLDISKLKNAGWYPKYNSDEAVRMSAEWLHNKNML